MKIRPMGPELFHAAERADMTKLSHFSQFRERTWYRVEMWTELDYPKIGPDIKLIKRY